MNDNPAIKGLIELIEKRYGLEVLDSHYVLVDEKFKQYNMMLYVKLPKQMLDEFKRLYSNKTSAMHGLRGSIEIKITLDSTLLLATISFCFLDSLLSKE